MHLSLRDLALIARSAGGGAPPPPAGPGDFAGLQGWWKADSFALSDNDPIGGSGVDLFDDYFETKFSL